MSAQRHAIEGSVVTYNAKLEIRLSHDGKDWLAWCPPIDVMTQASTRNKALEAIKEAVEGWFESCIERGVLPEALREAGFLDPSEWSEAQQGASVVGLEAGTGESLVTKTAGGPRQSESGYIEVAIPAYIAEQYNLADAGRASR